MTHHKGADFDQLQLEVSQRTFRHCPWQLDAAQEDAEVVGQRIKLQPRLGFTELLAPQPCPVEGILALFRLVEESHLSARLTLAKLGIPRTTFYRWYDRYLQRGEAGLKDQSPKPKHVWNRVPDEVKRKVVDFALQETELSPRELAVTFRDQERYFVLESTVYRTLKAHDLITSPAFIVLKAANEFKDKTTAINQLWQTNFTYIKVLGWGVLRTHLSTVLDDYSRYIVSWKLCTNMRAADVTDTLDLALKASGCDQVHVVHKPRRLETMDPVTSQGTWLSGCRTRG